MKCKKLLSVALAVCMTFGSAAALPEGVFVNQTEITASAVSDGDWEYVVLDDDTISLTKYNGGGGTVNIPSSFEDKDVVSFGTIFKGNKNIAKVIIPDTVTNIADNAFNNCTNLSGVTIGAGVKNIGDFAFRDCASLSSIVFPNSLTNIGEYAFDNCQQLRTIRIPGTVKVIGNYAFNDMYWLNTLILEPSPPPLCGPGGDGVLGPAGPGARAGLPAPGPVSLHEGGDAALRPRPVFRGHGPRPLGVSPPVHRNTPKVPQKGVPLLLKV